MSKLKHTPGPWKFNVKKENGLYQLSGENGSQIGRLWGNKHTDANARLIATSPEMLELLISEYKEMCNVCTLRNGDACEQDGCPNNTLIKSVIEKATGLKIEEVLS